MHTVASDEGTLFKARQLVHTSKPLPPRAASADLATTCQGLLWTLGIHELPEAYQSCAMYLHLGEPALYLYRLVAFILGLHANSAVNSRQMYGPFADRVADITLALSQICCIPVLAQVCSCGYTDCSFRFYSAGVHTGKDIVIQMCTV